MWPICLGVEFLRTVSRLETSKEYSTSFVHVLHKICIRKFHVVVVQWTLTKCTKKRDSRAEMLFGSQNQLFFFMLSVPLSSRLLKVRRNGQQNHATCLATLLQNEMNSDVASFTRLLTGLNVGGKTGNIVFQFVLQQCCKTSCTFLSPVLPKL